MSAVCNCRSLSLWGDNSAPPNHLAGLKVPFRGGETDWGEGKKENKKGRKGRPTEGMGKYIMHPLK